MCLSQVVVVEVITVVFLVGVVSVVVANIYTLVLFLTEVVVVGVENRSCYCWGCNCSCCCCKHLHTGVVLTEVVVVGVITVVVIRVITVVVIAGVVSVIVVVANIYTLVCSAVLNKKKITKSILGVKVGFTPLASQGAIRKATKITFIVVRPIRP